MDLGNLKVGLAFDDVLLLPQYSSVIPRDVDIRTRLTQRIALNTPLMSAAMDRVTEVAMAIAMAREGGLGVIHKGLSPAEQAEMVHEVKRTESWLITDPFTIGPEVPVSEALMLVARHGVSGLPVVVNGRPVGIVTKRDLRHATQNDARAVREVMTGGRSEPITALKGVTLDEAQEILQKNRIEKLLVVDRDGKLVGLITERDLAQAERYPLVVKDADGHLLVAAAAGATEMDRIRALVGAGVDVVVIDSAHGHSENVLETLERARKEFPDLDIVAGNIATAKAAQALIEAGVDAIKVGIGPGSICTTRVVAGIGVPQFTAINDCAEVAQRYDIPVIADGGIKYSGDLVKALAIGGSVVMVGSLLAGADETPGETILQGGRSYKEYRGMGSLGAMRSGGAERYRQGGTSPEKLVPEGIEGLVPARGPVSRVIHQLMGGLRAGMGYVGAHTLKELQEHAEFVRQTASGLRESHPHDVIITAEAPNYSVRRGE